MTLKTPGALAWENLDEFFDADDFATPVTVTATGVLISGLYQSVSSDGGDLGGPAVLVKQVDVDDNSISHGTSLELDGETRLVAGLRFDGHGTVEILLDA